MASKSSLLSQKVIRVLVVDDHPMMREGLASRIDQQSDMKVCGDADSLITAIAAIQANSPDVVIVDIQLVDSNGIELLEEIRNRFPSTRALVVSAFDDSLYAERALRAGAKGYVNKRELQDCVVDAIKTVANGGTYVSNEITKHLVNQAISGKLEPGCDPVHSLSNRELEVFQLIGQGVTTSAIAEKLYLSVHTIDTHREKLRHKLGLKTGTELMRYAVQWVLENGQ
jgi:DNA-binding NarL/FixJ family response regulator